MKAMLLHELGGLLTPAEIPVATAATLPMCLAALGRGGQLLIVGNRPRAVFKMDPAFPVDPAMVLYKELEIHV